jgi:hypothetical protein
MELSKARSLTTSKWATLSLILTLKEEKHYLKRSCAGCTSSERSLTGARAARPAMSEVKVTASNTAAVSFCGRTEGESIARWNHELSHDAVRKENNSMMTRVTRPDGGHACTLVTMTLSTCKRPVTHPSRSSLSFVVAHRKRPQRRMAKIRQTRWLVPPNRPGLALNNCCGFCALTYAEADRKP